MKNAMMKVCLAGGHLSSQLMMALDAMDAEIGDNFILLLSNPDAQQYRALYAFDPATGEVRARGVCVFVHGCCGGAVWGARARARWCTPHICVRVFVCPSVLFRMCVCECVCVCVHVSCARLCVCGA